MKSERSKAWAVSWRTVGACPVEDGDVACQALECTKAGGSEHDAFWEWQIIPHGSTCLGGGPPGGVNLKRPGLRSHGLCQSLRSASRQWETTAGL